jgi:multiple sugar transport system ATP-binding protein
MNLVERDDGSLGFRPEHFLPREMLTNGSALAEFAFRIERMEYLGSERILYGEIDGMKAKRVITAKLPAHAASDRVRAGDLHAFAVRRSELHYFGLDGRRVEDRPKVVQAVLQ